MALCSVAPVTPGFCDPSEGWSIAAAAEELWRSLHAPLRITWEVPLHGDLVAGVTAQVCQESTWPPTRVSLQLTSKGRLHSKRPPDAGASRKDGSESDASFEIQVPSNASVQQVAELVTASCALAGFNMESTELAVESLASTDSTDPGSFPTPVDLGGAPTVIDHCEERKISQLQCLKQWHHDVCGHHALFNLRCLLRNELDFLRDEQRFWRQVIADIQRLAHFGERSGSWPRSRVVCGVADEVHLRHLVQHDDDLRGHITLASSIDSLKDQLRGLRKPLALHGFLLGAATHWYSAAVVLPEKSEPKIYFFDSYNVPVVSLKSNEDIEKLLEELLHQSRTHSLESLKRDPYWAHRPTDHIEDAVERGVEEWWKGARKASMFWRHQPLEVRRELKRMDLVLVRDFLQLLLAEFR